MLLLLHDGMSSNARSRSVDLRDYRACTSKGLSWFAIDERGGRLPQCLPHLIGMRKTSRQKDEPLIVLLLKSVDHEHIFGNRLVL